MQHDRDAINKAKKRNLFDDSFDSMSLGLSDKEKKKMIKSLRKNNADNKGDEGVLEKNTKNKKNLKDKKNKPGIIQRIIRFFYMLFTGVKKEEYEIKQKLKEIKHELKKIKPPIFNFKTNSITSSLAYQVFNIYENILTYRTTFDKIFDNSNSTSHLSFQLFFFTNSFQ